MAEQSLADLGNTPQKRIPSLADLPLGISDLDSFYSPNDARFGIYPPPRTGYGFRPGPDALSALPLSANIQDRRGEPPGEPPPVPSSLEELQSYFMPVIAGARWLGERRPVGGLAATLGMNNIALRQQQQQPPPQIDKLKLPPLPRWPSDPWPGP